jgi:hypothetical protein
VFNILIKVRFLEANNVRIVSNDFLQQTPLSKVIPVEQFFGNFAVTHSLLCRGAQAFSQAIPVHDTEFSNDVLPHGVRFQE